MIISSSSIFWDSFHFTVVFLIFYFLGAKLKNVMNLWKKRALGTLCILFPKINLEEFLTINWTGFTSRDYPITGHGSRLAKPDWMVSKCFHLLFKCIGNTLV